MIIIFYNVEGWGIVKSLIDIFVNLPEATFLILKDPNEQKVKVFQTPDGGARLPGFGEKRGSADIDSELGSQLMDQPGQ